MDMKVHDARTCRHCSAQFQSRQPSAVYCSKRCKRAGWLAQHPERAAQYQSAKAARYAPHSAYHAGHCNDCGAAWGGRSVRTLCVSCTRDAQLAAARQAARDRSEAMHRAAGRVVVCARCSCEFCPLYGTKPGGSSLWRCEPCSVAARKEWRKACGGSNPQRAKRAGVPYRYFDERMVLERDGWRCQLCGKATPEEARGSTRDDAPEFDHCIPLARGGPHVPENGQCLCRSCNGAKGDQWCERSVAAAVARGVVVPLPTAEALQPRYARGGWGMQGLERRKAETSGCPTRGFFFAASEIRA